MGDFSNDSGLTDGDGDEVAEGGRGDKDGEYSTASDFAKN
jgi:hypothetical protein